MSRNIGSHTFRNAANGSVIHVDVGLHEDIDYDFFDSGDRHSAILKPNENKNSTIIDDEENEDKDEGSSFKLTSCGDGTDMKSGKVIKLNVSNVKQTDLKNKTESAVHFSSVKFSADSSKEAADKTNLKKSIINPKEEKYMNLRDLMNCIAYGESKEKNDHNDDDDDHVISKVQSISPDFLSLSTDTTSEITDVTTRPSSSGCSSMSKHESGEHLSDIKTSKTLKNAQRKQQEHDKHIEGSTGTSMKLLLDALDSFDRQKRKSVASSILSTEQKNRLERKNMSFSNEQSWKIERENEILLKKLEAHRKPRPKQSSRAVSQPRLSSSAINRRKQQAKIEHDNMILLKKIEQAKPSSRIAMSAMRR